MSKKINPGEIIKIGAILFLITSVAAVLLAFVNQKTAPLIAENNMKKTQAAMKGILPSADHFEVCTASDNDKVAESYAAVDASGQIVGACVVVSENGYGGEVRVLTGVDSEGRVAGVDILSHSETPGLGANAVKDEFKGQFKGKAAGINAVKTAPADNDIQAMSGATITSKAVTEAVNTGLSEAEKIMSGEGR